METQPPTKTPEVQDVSLAEPFAFKGRLQALDARMDFIPVLDLIVIAMLFSLLFTRFVSLPGVRVDLPVMEMKMQHSPQSVAVLTIGNRGMLFFNGAVYEARTIRGGFDSYMAASNVAHPILLIKADSTMELQEFLRLCESAKEVGFAQVHLAGKSMEPEAGLLPTTLESEAQNAFAR